VGALSKLDHDQVLHWVGLGWPNGERGNTVILEVSGHVAGRGNAFELGMIYGTHFGMISCQMIAGAGMNGELFGGAIIPAPVIHPFLRIRLGVQHPEFDPPRLPLGLSAKTH
jgi:hypothetical protein